MKKIFVLLMALSCVFASRVVELNDIALELIHQGEYYPAIDSLMVAHPIDKNHIETYYNLGLAYQKLFHYEEALRYYAIAFRHFPDRLQLRWNYARIYDAIGQYDKAAEHLEFILENNPTEDLLDKATAFYDTVQYRDSSKATIILMDKNDVVKHNEDDVLYYAFRCGAFYSDTNDTVLIFERGRDLEQTIIAGIAFNGRRLIRATLPKRSLVDFWRNGSRNHSLLGYYIKPNGNFFLRIQLEERNRFHDPNVNDLVQRFTYKFYDVEIDREGACWYLIDEGIKQEPECFYFRDREN